MDSAVPPSEALELRSSVSLVRWTRAALGLGCFALGAVGAVVPGLPTTVFLLVGSYLLTRSCPVLEQRLRSSRLFRPYAVYLDPAVPLPRRARVTALVGMWGSTILSALILYSGRPSRLVPAILLGSGVLGTMAILRFRRGTHTPDRAL
jgi:uncharacterized membrane protein YbaN (DUF454 family)